VKLAVQYDPVFIRRSGSSLEQNQFLPEEPTPFSVLIFDYRPIGDRREHICRSSHVMTCAVEVLHHIPTPSLSSGEKKRGLRKSWLCHDTWKGFE
jgi:hypothetical protein